jgi:hypothetical protein
VNEDPSKIKKNLWIVFFGVLLLTPVGIFSGCVIAGAPDQGSPTSVPGYPAPGTPTFVSSSRLETPVPPEVQEILEYKEQLKNNKDLSEEMRETLLNKIEILSRVVTQRAMIKETAGITPYSTPAPPQDSHLLTGLYEGGTSDFHAWEADIKNIWRQYIGKGEYIGVYAGELGTGTPYPGRGVIYVLRINATSRKGTREEYLLPEGTGWVRVSEVRGDYLILTSKEGKTFYFYLPGQQFVDSLDEVVPTLTPLPTPGPPHTIGPAPEPTSPYPYPQP